MIKVTCFFFCKKMNIYITIKAYRITESVLQAVEFMAITLALLIDDVVEYAIVVSIIG